MRCQLAGIARTDDRHQNVFIFLRIHTASIERRHAAIEMLHDEIGDFVDFRTEYDDLFRIRWTQRFKWVAICTEGEWKDKKLSEVTKDFTTSFRWKDGVYHGWFKEPGSALPVILPPIIKLL